MPLYDVNDKTIFFSHIPKSGGTSVNNALSRLSKTVAYCDEGNDDWHRVRRISPQHYHYELISEIINFDDVDYCFALVRDPVARLYSEYKHQQSFSERPFGMPTDPGKWYEWARSVTHADPSAFDNHLRSQNEFIGKQFDLLVFPGQLGLLCERLGNVAGAKIEIEHLNQRVNIGLAGFTPFTRGEIISDYSDDNRLYQSLLEQI